MIDFLIIGAQKAGTTSLFAYLKHSHHLFMPDVKEVHYFDLYYHESLDWYHAFFPGLKGRDKQVWGEASPYYLFHPLVPQRAFEYNPNLKLILLLRNPIDRAISHYNFMVKLGLEMEKDMDTAFALEKERTEKDTHRIIKGEIATSPLHQHFTYVQRSIYTPQIKRWLRYFSKDQMLVLQSESFFASPGQALEEIGDFLDIPITMPPQFEIHNETKYEKLKSPYLDALMPTWLEDQTNLQALFPHLRGWFHHQ